MIKYIGTDAKSEKKKNKKFIDLTLLDDADHSKRIVLQSHYDSNSPAQLELRIIDASPDHDPLVDIVIDCGTI